MSAGLEGFLTGFFGARAESMQRDQDKADAYEERMRNIAQRNSIIAQNRTSMADAAKSMGDKLLAWGATPAQIQAALGSGQTGLADLYKTVSTVNSTLGAEEAKRFLGTVGEDLGAASAVGKEGLANLYKSTFGLPMGMKTGDYKAPEESTLAKLFGYTDRKAKVMQELDAELSGSGGYSVYDLTTIGSLPDYIPGSSGENITYKTPSIYTKAEYADSIKDVDASLRLMESSDKYKDLSKTVTSLSDQITKLEVTDLDDAATKKIAELNTLKQQKQQELNAMRDSVLKESVLTQSSLYFNSDTYLEDMSRYVTNSLGYTPSWMGELVESEKAVNEVVNKSLGGSLTAQPESQTAAALKDAKPTVVKTITSESGVDLNVVEVDGKTLVQTKDGVVLSEEDSTAVIAAAEEAGTVKEPERKYSTALDTKDGSVSSYKRYENMYKGLMELPEDQRSDYLDAFDSLEGIPSIKDAVEVIIEDTPAAADALGGYAYGGVGYGVSLATEGMAAAYAFITGDTAKAAKVKANASQNREKAKEIMADGIVKHLQKVVDENDIKGGFGPDRAKAVKRAVLENKPLMKAVDDMIQENVDGALEANPDNPMVKVIAGMLGGEVAETPQVDTPVEDLAAAAQRAPDHIVKLGEQATKAWRDLVKYFNEDKATEVLDAVNSAPEDRRAGMIQEITDYIDARSERGFGKTAYTSGLMQPSDSFEQPEEEPTYNPRAVGTVGFRDFGLREDIRDVVEALDTKEADRKESERQTIEAYDRQFIRDWEGMPVRDKAIIRDVLYGKKKEEFTDAENARLNEMRKSNPEWFIDTPPELLGAGMPASEYDTTFKSRTDRPTGMMSPMPATDAELEGTPTIGTDTELDNMLVRVHGKKGDAMQSFLSKVRTGKAKAVDVTRIINSTKKLPKTGTRDKVLEKLYALRDSMK